MAIARECDIGQRQRGANVSSGSDVKTTTIVLPSCSSTATTMAAQLTSVATTKSAIAAREIASEGGENSRQKVRNVAGRRRGELRRLNANTPRDDCLTS